MPYDKPIISKMEYTDNMFDILEARIAELEKKPTYPKLEQKIKELESLVNYMIKELRKHGHIETEISNLAHEQKDTMEKKNGK